MIKYKINKRYLTQLVIVGFLVLGGALLIKGIGLKTNRYSKAAPPVVSGQEKYKIDTFIGYIRNIGNEGYREWVAESLISMDGKNSFYRNCPWDKVNKKFVLDKCTAWTEYEPLTGQSFLAVSGYAFNEISSTGVREQKISQDLVLLKDGETTPSVTNRTCPFGADGMIDFGQGKCKDNGSVNYSVPPTYSNNKLLQIANMEVFSYRYQPNPSNPYYFEKVQQSVIMSDGLTTYYRDCDLTATPSATNANPLRNCTKPWNKSSLTGMVPFISTGYSSYGAFSHSRTDSNKTDIYQQVLSTDGSTIGHRYCIVKADGNVNWNLTGVDPCYYDWKQGSLADARTYPPAVNNYKITVSQTAEHTINPNLFGANYYLADQNHKNQVATFNDLTAIKSLNSKILRFNGGCFADVYHWNALDGTKEGVNRYYWYSNNPVPVTNPVNQYVMSIPEAKNFANNLNAKILYQANVEYVASSEAKKNACGLVSTAINAAASISDYKIYLKNLLELALTDAENKPIDFVELGNEQSLMKSWDANEYYDFATESAQIVRTVAPSAKIIVVGGFSTYGASGYDALWKSKAEIDAWQNLMAREIKQKRCKDANNTPIYCFDYVSDHPYPYNTMSYNVIRFPSAEYSYILDARINALARTGDNEARYIPTEWNLTCFDTNNYNPYLGTVSHGFYVGETLLLMMKKNVQMAIFHDILRNDSFVFKSKCGLMQNATNVSTIGEVFRLISNSAGGRYVPVTNSSPTYTLPIDPTCPTHLPCVSNDVVAYVTSYAVLGSNNKLYLYFINYHPQKYAAFNLEFKSNPGQTLSYSFPSGTTKNAYMKVLLGNTLKDIYYTRPEGSTTITNGGLINLRPNSITRYEISL